MLYQTNNLPDSSEQAIEDILSHAKAGGQTPTPNQADNILMAIDRLLSHAKAGGQTPTPNQTDNILMAIDRLITLTQIETINTLTQTLQPSAAALATPPHGHAWPHDAA